MSPVCSDLHCPNEAGDDGCHHDPEEPWCAEHLDRCVDCRAAIEWGMPRAAS